MPNLETDCLEQDAVLFAKAGYDKYGEPTITSTTGTAIKCRWEVSQSEAVDPFGNTIAIDSTVYVDREIAIGSLLWKGAIASIADPPVDLKEVVTYEEIPDIKNRYVRRLVGVVKYSDSQAGT
jgi:hypothetical protein